MRVPIVIFIVLLSLLFGNLLYRWYKSPPKVVGVEEVEKIVKTKYKKGDIVYYTSEMKRGIIWNVFKEDGCWCSADGVKYNIEGYWVMEHVIKGLVQ